MEGWKHEAEVYLLGGLCDGLVALVMVLLRSCLLWALLQYSSHRGFPHLRHPTSAVYKTAHSKNYFPVFIKNSIERNLWYHRSEKNITASLESKIKYLIQWICTPFTPNREFLHSWTMPNEHARSIMLYRSESGRNHIRRRNTSPTPIWCPNIVFPWKIKFAHFNRTATATAATGDASGRILSILVPFNSVYSKANATNKLINNESLCTWWPFWQTLLPKLH